MASRSISISGRGLIAGEHDELAAILHRLSFSEEDDPNPGKSQEHCVGLTLSIQIIHFQVFTIFNNCCQVGARCLGQTTAAR